MEKMSMNLVCKDSALHDADGPDGLAVVEPGSFPDTLYFGQFP